jgi:hypothetical protein
MTHWVSCTAFTVRVETDAGGRITWAAPIVRKFVGQPLANLLRWAGSRGGLRHEEL